jgi:hypothetical protein
MTAASTDLCPVGFASDLVGRTHLVVKGFAAKRSDAKLSELITTPTPKRSS